MVRPRLLVVLTPLVTTLAGCETQPADSIPVTEMTNVLAYTMNRIDGSPQPLSDYRGDVILIVNTASECGLTPQYESLERLYREKKDQGFVVLGFPSNDFASQEPGSNQEIAAFCEREYAVTFPMFQKISVKGENADRLYQDLAAVPDGAGGVWGEPQWNFQKYLVGRDGRVIAKYSPKVTPDDPELIAAIDAALNQH